MRVIGPEEVDAALSYPKLIDILAAAFVSGVIGPPRHHHTIKLPGGASDATLLLMPAWTTSAPGAETAGDYIGWKAVSVFPDNRVRKLPAVQGAYVLFSARTGEPLALIDAPRLTAWRTAAASALAARSLARADASRLLVVGTGALAEFLIRAHASVRPIREVALWNRTRAGAEELAASLAEMTDLRLSVAEDLERAVRSADIVSTATISRTPLVRGEWLQPGVHLDCVGAYKPDMRETDDRAVQRARIWVDTRAGAFKEAGDIVIPIASGAINAEKIEGDLFGLAAGSAPVRSSPSDITMFKSVGASIEDLAAAVYVYERSKQ